MISSLVNRLGRQSDRLLEHLTTPLVPEAYVSTLAPLRGRRLRGVIEEVRPLTGSAAAITITTGSSWTPHRAGQFVTVGVDVDGVRYYRCYSITSVPSDRDGRCSIEIGVQAQPDGVVSAHLVHRARPGDVVQLEQADGDFTLPDGPTLPDSPTLPNEAADPLLFVTGGSGITPVIGMLRTLAARAGAASPEAPMPSIRVLHHTPTLDRVMYANELTALAARLPGLEVEIVETRAGAGPSSHLDAPRLDRRCEDWRDRQTYVCGPASLVDFAVTHWAAAGIADRLHVERFTLATPATAEPTAAGQSIEFARSGASAVGDGSTPLLELAEGAGLAPAHGCRMGICRTCSTRLESGCVRDLRDGRTHGSGEHVQLCVTTPLDDVVLDL